MLGGCSPGGVPASGPRPPLGRTGGAAVVGRLAVSGPAAPSPYGRSGHMRPGPAVPGSVARAVSGAVRAERPDRPQGPYLRSGADRPGPSRLGGPAVRGRSGLRPEAAEGQGQQAVGQFGVAGVLLRRQGYRVGELHQVADRHVRPYRARLLRADQQALTADAQRLAALGQRRTGSVRRRHQRPRQPPVLAGVGDDGPQPLHQRRARSRCPPARGARAAGPPGRLEDGVQQGVRFGKCR